MPGNDVTRFHSSSSSNTDNSTSSIRSSTPTHPVPMYRRFLPDGTFAHKPPSSLGSLPLGDAAASSSTEPCPSSTRAAQAAQAASARLEHRVSFAVAPLLDALEDDPEIQEFIPPITWRFTKSRNGKRGQFIQVNRWPAYTITRCPNDWSWVLESDWVRYRSCSPQTLGLGDGWLGGDPVLDDDEYDDDDDNDDDDDDDDDEEEEEEDDDDDESDDDNDDDNDSDDGDGGGGDNDNADI